MDEQYEFKDWKKAFSEFYRLNKLHGGVLVLIISTHWATSGYWIEEMPYKPNDTDYVYTGEEVEALERRIVLAHEQASREGKSVSGLIL